MWLLCRGSDKSLYDKRQWTRRGDRFPAGVKGLCAHPELSAEGRISTKGSLASKWLWSNILGFFFFNVMAYLRDALLFSWHVNNVRARWNREVKVANNELVLSQAVCASVCTISTCDKFAPTLRAGIHSQRYHRGCLCIIPSGRWGWQHILWEL